MGDRASERDFKNDTHSSLEQAIPKLQAEARDGLQHKAQEVAPIFFRGQNGQQGVPAEPVRPAGMGVPGVPVPAARPGDAPPPKKGSLLGISKDLQGPSGAPEANPPAGGDPLNPPKKDWRAHPFNEKPAPGFFRKQEVPPHQKRGGIDAEPPAEPAKVEAGKGNGQAPDMRASINRLAPLVERQLDPASGFWGNALIAGSGAMLGGGPLARALDYGTKSYLANTEPSRFRIFNLLEQGAAIYQRHHGLVGAESALAPLFERERNVADALRTKADTLSTVVQRAEQEAAVRRLNSLTAVEREALGRYAYLNGQNPPAGLQYVPDAADDQLRKRLVDLAVKIDELHRDKLAHDPIEWNRLTTLDRDIEARLKPVIEQAEKAGQPVLDKFERAGQAAVSTEELFSGKKYQFFKDYLDNPNRKPADYGVILSTEEQLILRDSAQVKKLLDNLEPTGRPALEKYMRAGEGALSDAEKIAMNRYRFFREFAADATKSAREFNAVLIGEESGLVTVRQQIKGDILRMEPFITRQAELPGLLVEHQRLSMDLDATVQRLKRQIEPLETKLAQPVENFMTQAEKNLIARYNYLKSGAAGEIPGGVVLDADEAKLVARRQAVANRIELVDPWQSPNRQALIAEREVIATRMKALADGMKDEMAELLVKIEGRPTRTRLLGAIPLTEQVPIETVLTPDEISRWKKYGYLKTGGQSGALPHAGVLTAEEAAVIARAADIEKALASSAKGDAHAATTWFKRTASGGAEVNGHFSNFARGMAAYVAADFLSDRIDNALYGKSVWDSHRGTTPYLTAITPWVGMAVPGGWFKKGGAMIGLNVAGSYLERALPVDTNSKWSKLLRPTGLDAALLGIGSAIPMRRETFAARLGYMGAALVVSKAGSHFLSAPSARETRDQAWELFKTDKTERTERSMTNTIEKLKKLDNHQIKGDAKQTSTVLEYYVADWMSRDHSKDVLNGDRGAAMFMVAAGEGRLDKGSRVAKGQGGTDDGKVMQTVRSLYNTYVSGNDQQFDYILAGRDYDLGGGALKYLVSARTKLERAKEETSKQVSANGEVRGTKVQQSEIADLEKVQKRVDSSLDKIYGRHDIPALLKEVQEYTFRLHQKDMARIRTQAKNTIADPKTDDPRYVAKFCRDVALIDLAWAINKMGAFNNTGSGRDGESAAIMLGEAKIALRKAGELDPKNPDLEQLNQILKEQEEKCQRTIKEQWSSTTFNPLEIPKSK
jgi:hypothetical protein